MSQYLTKEEIKRWRSSLEKITLEEYAKKLGKVIEEEKHTSDIIDIIMKNDKRLYSTTNNSSAKNKILTVAKNADDENKKHLCDKESPLAHIKSKITCKKPLTERENTVLEHFAKNEGQIVYAKDLAALLNLPSDYIYKYIKNLRTKIAQDVLENATKGGYIFTLKN